MGTTTMARLHEELSIGAHEWHRHGHFAAVGEHEPCATTPVVLDNRKEIVPPTCVETCSVIAECIENLVHLEGSGESLNQHSGTNGSVLKTKLSFSEAEDIIPELGFLARFEFREIDVGSGPTLDQLVRVLENIQAEVDETSRCRSALTICIDEADVLFHEMPTAWAHHDCGRVLVGDAQRFALTVGRCQSSSNGLVQRDLSVNNVVPRWAGRIFKVSEPHISV